MDNWTKDWKTPYIDQIYLRGENTTTVRNVCWLIFACVVVAAAWGII